MSLLQPIRFVCVALAVVTTSGCIGVYNFHIVEKDQVYRSAQLPSEGLATAIQELGIKTVLNLRGQNTGEDWYDQELEVAQTHGVTLIDISMSARRIPDREELVQLLDAFESADRPLLIHCNAGADRTGLASAIYQLEYMGKSKDEAREMLSARYRHFRQFHPGMLYFFDVYQGKDWAYLQYDPCVQKYRYYDQKRCKSTQ